jgi:hypothetical protein
MCIFAALAPLGALFGIGGGAAAGATGAAAGATSGIGTALQALGLVASVGGSLAGAKASENVSNYNVKVAENNATAERQRAAYDAGLQRDQVRRVVGAQRAAGAASGLDITSGTPVAVLGDTAKQGELDVLARLYSGESAATAYQNDARRMKAEGKAQKQAGFINAGTSLLSGLGKMAATSQANRYGLNLTANV